MTDTGTTTITTLEERREAVLAVHRAADAGDWDRVLAACDPEIVWVNDPGAGPWAGRFEGVEAVATMFGEYLEFLDGTFTYEVVDVCVSAERSMSFVIERGAKGGHAYENRAVWIWRFNGGWIVDVLTVDLDRDAALEFWRSVTG
jgi:ketosteroid isomerase-like protein